MTKKTTKARFTAIKVGKIAAVKDANTGLIWQQTGSPERLTHAQAEAYVKKLGKGWRLPTVEELFCLADRTRVAPAINPIFACESSWYWTATPYAGGAGAAWVVYFGSGSSYWSYRYFDGFVRAVRASQ